MCIAIYSPVGNPIPCEEYLKRSFEENPNGAGFAYNLPNKPIVQIEKGFMDWKSFIKAFRKSSKKYDFTNRGVLIHFRITTHGGTNPQCCHPFPLVADEETMKKTKIKSNYAVIHNGIISLTSDEALKRNHMSDTMVFIEKYLSKIATNKKWFANKANFELIYDMIGSKMAILNGYGKIHSTAGFTKDPDGNYYSNTTYKYPKWSYYDHFDYFDYGYEYPKYAKYNKNKNTVSFADSGIKVSSSASNALTIAKSSKNNIVEEDVVYFPIMKVEPGMTAIVDSLDYPYDESDPMFMNADGEFFYVLDPEAVDDEEKVLDEDNLGYLGMGCILDGISFREIDFDPKYTMMRRGLTLYE